jgi:hypothetical protein
MSEIIIMTITKTEIHQLVESAVLKALNQKSSNQKSDQDSFLGVDEAASFLGIAKATLYGKCSQINGPAFQTRKETLLSPIRAFQISAKWKEKNYSGYPKSSKQSIIGKRKAIEFRHVVAFN